MSTPASREPRRRTRSSPTTRSCCCPSAARSSPTTCCRSCAPSPPGASIPDERLEAVGEHYYGVRRPQPDQRPEPRPARRAARRARPARRSRPRCSGATATSTPFVDRRPARGARGRAYAGCVTVVTSAYSCYSSCRQYREDLAARGRRRWPTRDSTSPSTRCGPTATTPASPAPTAGWSPRPPAARCAAVPDDRRPRCCSSPTRSPTAMDDTSGPGDGEGNALPPPAPALGGGDHRRGQRHAEPRPGLRRAGLLLALRAADASRGSSRTSTTGSRSWPPRA